MNQPSTEVHAGSIQVGTPTEEQLARQRAWEEANRRAEALTPEQVEKLNIHYTGSPAPNRAQRRAAEKRLRRQQRNKGMK